MECATECLQLSLPAETVALLRAYAKAMNSPIDNAASAAIRDGIEAKVLLHPSFIDRMGVPMLVVHGRSTAAMLADSGRGTR